MDTRRKAHLIKQRAVARGMLSRIQNFINTGDCKLNELQVRLNKLPDIFNRYDVAQSELELSDDMEQFNDREVFEVQYYQVEARFNELLHPVVEPPRSTHSSSRTSGSGHSNTSPRS
jgi:hypothetical protein